MKNSERLSYAGEVDARKEYPEKTTATRELSSKLCAKSGNFAKPALRLGRWFGALVLVGLTGNLNAQTNTQRVWTGGSNAALKTSTNWNPNTGNISVSTDSIFTNTTSNVALTGTTGTVGSLNANGTANFKIFNNTSGSSNDSTLTLGGAGNNGNSFSGIATDLIYVSSGADFTIQGPTAGTSVLKVALGQNGTFNIAGTAAISSAISGTNYGITKTGSGTLTLNGTNTYTGSTTISAGKLVLGSAGSIASSSVLKIASGATFDVKAKSSGFTLNNSMTIDVDAANAGKLDATGVALTYGGNLTLNITTATPLSSYNLFTLGSETGTFSNINLSGSFTGSMTGNSGIWTASSNGYEFTFTESTGILQSSTAAIPEPGTWVLIGIAAAFSLHRIRRNTTKSAPGRG